MSTATKQAIELLEFLPESEQNFALEFIKKLVLAWDPDFTKLTLSEKKELEEIEKDMAERDYRDMHRETAPLRQAEDAVLVDSSDMTIDEVVDRIKALTAERR